jgi:hypothetical protein
MSNKSYIKFDLLTIDIQIQQYANNHKYKYDTKHIIYMCIGMYSLRKCCTQLSGAHQNYAHKPKDLYKQICKLFSSNKATAQIGSNVRICVFNAGLLARSQFASGRSCKRRIRSRFSAVFLGPRANVELVPKFHVALHASHVALPLVTSTFRHNAALPTWYKY